MPLPFVVARNPEDESSLPYLIFVPIGPGVWFKARETFPRASRVYCHAVPAPDNPAALQILERVAVVSCERRGPVIDLVLERGVNRRSQFFFTAARGREMIFWQTPKVAQNARPGLRVPARPASALERIVIDTRERFGYSFKSARVPLERAALRVGDYIAFASEGIAVGVVERKSFEDFCGALVDGSLGFAMAELAAATPSAVVVEGTYTQLLRRGFVADRWLPMLAARLQVRYANVPIVFVETRALGERWTHEFFLAAAAERDHLSDALSALIVAEEPKKRRKRRSAADFEHEN